MRVTSALVCSSWFLCSLLLLAQLSLCSHPSPVLLALNVTLLMLAARRASLKAASSTSSSASSSSSSSSSSSPCPQSTSSSPLHRRRQRRHDRPHPYSFTAPEAAGAASPSGGGCASSTGEEMTPPCCSVPIALASVTCTSMSPSSSSPPCSAASSPSSASPFPDVSSEYPALRSCPYVLHRTLQASLFGCVKLAHHAGTGELLCIKMSLQSACRERVTLNGATVTEDVRRESRLLQRLHGVDGVVELRDELEDDLFHYLVTPYCGHDLYVMLMATPVAVQEKVGLPAAEAPLEPPVEAVAVVAEQRARHMFLQLVRAVRACHRRHVALNDLSLENVCVDANDRVTLIDLGLAQVHPDASRPHPHSPSAGGTVEFERFPVPATPLGVPLCGKEAYMVSLAFTRAAQRSVRRASRVPLTVRAVLRCCGVQSPECYMHQSYDAFAHDRYALGVILYTLVMGRPPYQHPNADDYWFNLVLSGRWREDAISQSTIGRYVFGSASGDVLDLLDGLIKEEPRRWTWQQIEQCRFVKGGEGRERGQGGGGWRGAA